MAEWKIKKQCSKGELGKPIFSVGDTVGFYIKKPNEENREFCVGKVEIVDRFGTFEQNVEPSYDVFVDKFLDTNEPCLVKHLRQSDCYFVEEAE